VTTCPVCHHPVLELHPGVLLEPEPHHLGVTRADGTSLNAADIRARIQGHRKHWCDTTRQAPNPQTALFD